MKGGCINTPKYIDTLIETNLTEILKKVEIKKNNSNKLIFKEGEPTTFENKSIVVNTKGYMPCLCGKSDSTALNAVNYLCTNPMGTLYLELRVGLIQHHFSKTEVFKHVTYREKLLCFYFDIHPTTEIGIQSILNKVSFNEEYDDIDKDSIIITSISFYPEIQQENRHILTQAKKEIIATHNLNYVNNQDIVKTHKFQVQYLINLLFGAYPSYGKNKDDILVTYWDTFGIFPIKILEKVLHHSLYDKFPTVNEIKESIAKHYGRKWGAKLLLAMDNMDYSDDIDNNEFEIEVL